MVRCACLAVQWFNPLVWAAAYLSRQDCETACDASAIGRLGEGERLAYGHTLVNMIAAGRHPAALFQTATTMTGSLTSIRLAGDPHRPEAPDDRPDPGSGPGGVCIGGGVRLWRGGAEFGPEVFG